MDTVKHLTENQLLGFAAGSLEKREQSYIGSHLLSCAACRNLLPLPTPQRIFAILTGEDEPEERKLKDKSLFLTLFSSVKSSFRNPPVLVWSLGSLMIILGFSVFVWFAVVSGSKTEDEIARGFDSGIVEIKQSKINRQNPPPTENISDNEKPLSPSKSNRDVADTKPIVLKTDSLKKRDLKLSEKKSQPKSIGLAKENISLTRGGPAKCGEENPVEMEIGSTNNQGLVFRWAKVPNAATYHLYISDDDEILIDEYETEQETSYVMRKTLDKAKTYKWKVIVTLENGSTTAGTSQKFTVEDIQQNQIRKSEKKRKSEVRCAENK